jgi:MFS family permease
MVLCQPEVNTEFRYGNLTAKAKISGLRLRRKMRYRFTGLNRTVFQLGLVALFADISSEMLYPLTPIFLTAVLGASFTSVGLIEGSAEGIASILKIFSGNISDKIGYRKELAAFGYLLSALSKPVIGVAQIWETVFLGRGLDRLGKGIRVAPRDALLADSANEGNQGAAFGWHRGMDSLGAVIGPLIAIMFISTDLQTMRKAYLWAVIPGLMAVLLLLTVRDRQAAHLSIAKEKLRLTGALSPSFKKYLAIWCLFSVVNSSDVFLLLKAGKSGLTPVGVVLLYCLYNLTYSLLSPILGGWSDRIGRKYFLIGGFLLFAAVYLGFAFAIRVWQFAILFAVYGCYMAATDGVGRAFAIDLLPKNARATGVGWLGFISGIATIAASTIAGLLWDHYGSIWPFLYGTIGSALAAVIFLLLWPQLVSGKNVAPHVSRTLQ